MGSNDEWSLHLYGTWDNDPVRNYAGNVNSYWTTLINKIVLLLWLMPSLSIELLSIKIRPWLMTVRTDFHYHLGWTPNYPIQVRLGSQLSEMQTHSRELTAPYRREVVEQNCSLVAPSVVHLIICVRSHSQQRRLSLRASLSWSPLHRFHGRILSCH